MSVGMTKRQIMTAAESICRRGTEVDTTAASMFDYLLDQLYTAFAWKNLSSLENVTLPGGSPTFELPATYNKAISLFVIDSASNPTNPPNIEVIYRPWEEFLTVSVPNTQARVPQIFSTNKVWTGRGNSGVEAYIYPIPQVDLVARLAFYYKPDYSIELSAYPDFPDFKLLIDLLSNELYRVTDPPKHDPNMLERIIHRSRQNLEESPFGFARQAPLDRSLFRKRSKLTNWLNRNR